MGLFWSMKPVPGMSKAALLRKVDVTTPLVFRLSVMDDHIPFADLQQLTTVVLVADEVQRWYKHGSVRRIVMREGSLRGTLFLPAGEGPFPGVLDMFGSAGGLAEFRAALLASRGFACFALAYIRYDDLPTSLAGIDFEYFLVTPLPPPPSQHGMSTNQVKALVNICGAPVYGSDELKKCGHLFWKGFKMDESKLRQTDEGVYLKDAARYDTEIIPAWSNNAQILYLCGEDDGVWRTDFSNTFIETCPEEKKNNIELIIYPGTGHLIEPPYMPVSRAMFHKVLGYTVVMGGKPKAHSAAQEDAWGRLLHFLQKHLPHEHHTSGRL
ncbi:acyl-coenzyme A thioesterase 5-like [Haliotis cracherodii]|uniref:acyl-coenzyme A thioesterase 5-like n=1 Tax=Haliotis cracherodii TaxID=6455 RepID=UPI0039EC12BD